MFLLKSYSKEVLLIKITSLAWLIGKLITWKVWISDRIFPVIPVFDFFPEFSNSFHSILFSLSLLGLIATFFFTEKKYIFILFFIIEFSSCLLDQMRWQPWEYQYILIFLFYLFYKKGTSQFLQLFTFTLAFIYIFSGLHKFNGGFLQSIWRNLILERFLHFDKNSVSNLWIHYSGLSLSIIEFSLGFALLILPKKKITAVFLIIMHGILLLILGPFGVNYNPSVWPWNFALMCFLFVIFYDKEEIEFNFLFFQHKFNRLVIVLVAVLPVSNFAGYWDSFLSFKVYPGNSRLLVFCTKNLEAYPELKIYETKTKFIKNRKGASIYLGKMVISELKVAIYPEERTFIKIKNEWNKKFPQDENVFFVADYPYKLKNTKEIK